MPKKSLNVLIIEDHPMIVDFYTKYLTEKFLLSRQVVFTVATICTEAFDIIEASNSSFDLALIDVSIPNYLDKNILSGADLAILLKEKNLSCKIIIITAHFENITIYNLAQKIEPDGVMIKNDVFPETFFKNIEQDMNDCRFYSPSVIAIIKNISEKGLFDECNRKILLYLSQGYKIKDLEPLLSLSLSAIQRRIAQMKDAFNISEDTNLVREAKRQKFI